MKQEDLTLFERSYCDCPKCVAACEHMPGMLAPGDMARIAISEGIPQGDTAWVEAHFEASPGALVIVKGKMERIPTIVPAQTRNGRCVFLTEDNKCAVHKVAPFGCSRFNVCTPHEDVQQIDSHLKASAAALACIAGDPEYMEIWQWLFQNDCRATPVEDRQQNLHDALDEIG